jgi:large subunit ribosomal protein L25
MADSNPSIAVRSREPSGSRSVRRLRREGNVPGVVYGGGEDPVAFSIGARDLRHALTGAGAVLDLSVDGAKATPVMVKELDRHPVNGETMHIDLLRVRMDRALQATVVLDLVGVDDAPGVKEGGVLEQTTRELTVEALPGDIPDTITHDASGLEVAATLTLGEITAPPGVTIIGEPDMVLASITAPRLQVESDTEIEAETEIVGEAAGEESSGEDSGEGGGDSAE